MDRVCQAEAVHVFMHAGKGASSAQPNNDVTVEECSVAVVVVDVDVDVAATVSLCRALYMMNLTQQARYLASNSGGSWFNSAFSYQVSSHTATIPMRDLHWALCASTKLDKGCIERRWQRLSPVQHIINCHAVYAVSCCAVCCKQNTIPVETFIGPYVPPQNLTKDALKEAGKGAQGAFAATISNAVIKMNAAAGAVPSWAWLPTNNPPADMAPGN
jgi:hypothetical protein